MNLRIVETVAGYYSFHLVANEDRVSLCGRSDIMPTSMTIGQWGKPAANSGIRFKWCSLCEQVADLPPTSSKSP